ncbi:MAG: phage/plasmid primase, P4 family [Chloroflexota bacterium]
MSDGYKPTDDEIGDMLIGKWDGNVRFFFGQWYQYADGVWLPKDSFKQDIWEQLKACKHYGIRPSANKVASIEKYLQAYLMTEDECIDSQHDFINLRNGMFNIRTDELVPHRRDFFMTSQLPFDYDADADCPLFRKFLRDSLLAPHSKETDWELEILIKEAMGYSLTSNTDFRVSFWLVGASGTGKSVLLNVLQALAGNSHTSIDLDQMTNNPYQLADIAGKRLVTFTEPKANSVLADNHYKRLVSQDQIMARQIFGKPFRFVPMCKVWGAMNELPRVIDRSDAIFNRIIIIPMNNVIPANKRDGQLTNKLRGELAGIFNLALIGLRRLRHAGQFTRVAQSENARSEYKKENDYEATFVDDWCIVEDGAKIGGQQLYDAYSAWCRRNGAQSKSSTRVARDWQRLGFERVRSNGTWYLGVKLNQKGKLNV